MQTVSAREYRELLASAMSRFGGQSIGIVGDTTSASADVANVVAARPLTTGMKVTGAGIPAGATIIAIDTAAGTITLSANATATAVGVALTAVGVVALSIHLCKTMPAPGTNPVPADFTADECDFTGYSAQNAGTLTGPYTNADGNAVLDSSQLTWVLTADPATGNDVVAYWVQYTIGATSYVQCWEPLPGTLPMQAAGDAVVITVPFQLPIAGSVTVIS